MKRSSWCCICLLWAVGCLTLWWMPACQAADDVMFRDLARKYFKDGDGADLAKVVGYTQPVKEVIALEYKVLLFGDGRERPVDPKTYDFRIGDKIRIAVEPLHDYYIYIFHIGASGKSEFLLPAEGERPPLAKAGKPVSLPNDGFLEFAEPPGKETLLVVATEKPVADLALLARLLTKKPDEKDTPEEQAVRKTIKATVSEAMKSARDRQKELLNKTVMYRGLTTDSARQDLAEDVRERGVKEGTFEEATPGGKDGTCALYLSTTKEGQTRLLVTIPLKSLPAQKTEKP
jgi:hypothetical protein